MTVWTMMRLGFCLAGVGIGIYAFRFLRRMLATYGVNTRHIAVKIGLIIAAVIAGAATADMGGWGMLIVMHLMVFAWLVQLLHFLFKKVLSKVYAKKADLWQKIYGSGVIPILLTVVLLFYGYWNLYHIVGTNYTVYTQKPIRDEGYRIALIADVHYGVSLDNEELQAVCDRISDENPDVVVLCGDIVDNDTTHQQMQQVFKTLGSIRSAYGTVYVHGNHDRPMSIVRSVFTQEELVAAIESAGITILQDDVWAVSEDFTIVGREDRSRSDRTPIDKLMAQVEKDAFVLTLDHQPNDYDENGKAGTDLLLSGHTHGGQLWPLDWLQAVIPFNDAVYGLTEIDEDSKAIVTSGLAGWSFPIKTAAPAEYVIIDILPQG